MSRSPRRKAIKRRRLHASHMRRFDRRYRTDPLFAAFVDSVRAGIGAEIERLIMEGDPTAAPFAWDAIAVAGGV